MKSLEALERIKENTQVNHEALMKGYEWPKARSNPSLEGDIELIKSDIKKFIKIQVLIEEYCLIDEMTDKEFIDTVVKIVERGER